MTDDVPGRPDQDRRLTKAERKEQARLEREEIQRRLASKRRTRTIAIAVGRRGRRRDRRRHHPAPLRAGDLADAEAAPPAGGGGRRRAPGAET